MNSQNKDSKVAENSEVGDINGHVHGPNCNHHHHDHHEALKPVVRTSPKVGRNDPCPCGSQKKFKKCCGN